MRHSLAVLFSIGIVLLLFLMMQQLLQAPTLAERQPPLQVDFIALQTPEPELNKRQRTLPKKPSEQPPPPLQMPVVAATKGRPVLPKIKAIKPKSFQFSSQIGEPTLAKLAAPAAPTQSKAPASTPSSQGQGLGKIEAIVHPKPIYPAQALIHRQEGHVVLKFTISKEGLPKDIQVIESKPQGLFDQAAIDALKQWRFKPTYQNGQKVERTNVIKTLDFIIQR